MYLSQTDKFVPRSADEAAKQLSLEFSDVFSEKVGMVPNYQVSLKFKDNVRPVFLKARPIPHALNPIVEQELQKLASEGIIEKVDQSEWGTPLVVIPKPNGQIRICADYEVTVNYQLHDSQYPIPLIHDIFAGVEINNYFPDPNRSNHLLLVTEIANFIIIIK